ncbi:unnamed protein product [Dovyalis caffra]|uniref:Uncharacterized protein n=1 Tax=Dovyalis caffra TaxID=77055 RepID=A0AAV1S980_9ROSI|nr:unnamed protein product [Dovyalis caffra]
MEPVGAEVDRGERDQSEEMVRAETEIWSKPKNGSVFPKKKRLVKSMMLYSFTSAFSSPNGTSPSCNAQEHNNASGRYTNMGKSSKVSDAD